MELIVKGMTVPEAIEFNFIELKAELEQKVAMYENLVYTEDQVPEAKKEVADLRKLVKALADERIKVKKEYLKPYEEFSDKINELSYVVECAVKLIDTQLKDYEVARKERKQEAIEAVFAEMAFPDFVPLDKIAEDKWLNAGTTMKKVKEALQEKLESIQNDMTAIESLPKFSFEAMVEYKRSLKLANAIQEGKRLEEIQAAKAVYEEKLAQETIVSPENASAQVPDGSLNNTVQEPAEKPDCELWEVRVWLTIDKARELVEFLKGHDIEVASFARAGQED